MKLRKQEIKKNRKSKKKRGGNWKMLAVGLSQKQEKKSTKSEKVGNQKS